MCRPFRAAVVVALMCTAACDDSAQAPSAPPPPVNTPSPAPLREVTILGTPTILQIGSAAQLRAVARSDDGFQEVTAQATWRSADDKICAVSPGGLVEGRGAGSTTLTATYSGLEGTASLTCGFSIAVVVHETPPTTDVKVTGARVEVSGGPLNGRTFETDANGRATLPVVAQPGFWLYFKKQGYDDLRVEIFELPRQTTLDVSLMPAPSRRMEFSGVCTGTYSGLRKHEFTTTREGRVRVLVYGTVQTEAVRLCAQVYSIIPGYPGNSALVSNCRGQAPTIADEALLLPAGYSLYFEPSSLCPAGTRWNVVMEYPR